MALYTICYVSTVASSFQEGEIRQLLHLSSVRNTKAEISGLLLYNEGNFLQILEGEKETVQNLYNRIKSDHRHHDVFTLLQRPIDHLLFNEYETGFSIINSRDQIARLDNYLEFIAHLESEITSSILPTIKGFLQNMSLKIP